MAERDSSSKQHRAVVVAARDLAAQAGAEILRDGGNAADAAVATAAALAVVDPANCGIGGYGGFAVVDRTGWSRPMQVNFNAAVPREFMPENVEPESSGTLVSPPAVVAGLCALQARFGCLSAPDVWEPAIRLARNGFRVGRDLAAALQWAGRKHRGINQAFRRVFIPDGQALPEGQLLCQPQLAATLEHIAARGGTALTSGPIGESICQAVRSSGGSLLPEDLRAVDAYVAEAAVESYEDVQVWMPDPEQCGSSVLAAALRELRLKPLGPARGEQYISALTQALMNAWRTRNARYCPFSALATQTSHLCTADRDGMLVTMTFTHGPTWFGSGLVAEETGIVLNAGVRIFARRVSDGALVAQPHLTPTVVRGSDVNYSLGTPGGTRIPAIVLQAILDLVHYHVPPEQAFSGARVSADADGTLEAEATVLAAHPQIGMREIKTREYFGPASGIARTSEGAVVAMLDNRFSGAYAYAS